MIPRKSLACALAIMMCSVAAFALVTVSESEAHTYAEGSCLIRGHAYTAGTYYDSTGYEPDLLFAVENEIESASVSRSGSIPPGMTEVKLYGLFSDDAYYCLTGTPTTSGVYTATYTLVWPNGTDVIVYTWYVNNPITYTFTFDPNGGVGGPATQYHTSTAISGVTSISKPTATPVRDGFTFKGWGPSNSSQQIYNWSNGTEIPVKLGLTCPNPNTTVYAVWIEDQTYTVTFDAHGGSVPSPIVVNQGSSVTLPASTRDGHIFGGWYTQASGGSLVGHAGDTYTPSGDITLHARWSVASVDITSTAGDLYKVTGTGWTYQVATSPADATVSVAGASWLSVVGGKTVTGVCGAPGDYTITVTASKAGYTQATQTFVLHVVPNLAFTSNPSAGFIVMG